MSESGSRRSSSRASVSRSWSFLFKASETLTKEGGLLSENGCSIWKSRKLSSGVCRSGAIMMHMMHDSLGKLPHRSGHFAEYCRRSGQLSEGSRLRFCKHPGALTLQSARAIACNARNVTVGWVLALECAPQAARRILSSACGRADAH